MAATPSHPVTNDELIKHRLKELEDFATGGRQMERDVDTLKVTVASMQGTLTEIQTELRKNDERTSQTLARLHQRLDAAMTEKAKEDGRAEGRAEAGAKTWRIWTYAVTTSIAFSALVFVVLNFAL